MLMTPRHPPRALRSLTTPTRPRPGFHLFRVRPSPNLRSASLPTGDRGPCISRRSVHSPVTYLNSHSTAVNQRRSTASVKGPRSWIYCRLRSFASVLLLATTHTDLSACVPTSGLSESPMASEEVTDWPPARGRGRLDDGHAPRPEVRSFGEENEITGWLWLAS